MPHFIEESRESRIHNSELRAIISLLNAASLLARRWKHVEEQDDYESDQLSKSISNAEDLTERLKRNLAAIGKEEQ